MPPRRRRPRTPDPNPGGPRRRSASVRGRGGRGKIDRLDLTSAMRDVLDGLPSASESHYLGWQIWFLLIPVGALALIYYLAGQEVLADLFFEPRQRPVLIAIILCAGVPMLILGWAKRSNRASLKRTTRPKLNTYLRERGRIDDAPRKLLG